MTLSEEQILVQDMARQFAQSELVPNAPEWDRNATFPDAQVAKMGELGLMGMLVPEDYDGGGADHVTYAIALEEIAAGDGACSTIMSVQNSTVNMPLVDYGTAEQKETVLKPLARGKRGDVDP